MLRRLSFALLGLFLLGAAFLSGAYVHKYRAAIRARLRSLQDSPVIQTNLYNLKVLKLAIPGEGRDGAIEALSDGLLFVNRRGRAWHVTTSKTLQPLALLVPINVSDFESDPFNATTTDQDRFSVKDLLVQSLPASRLRIVASHLYWHRDRHCNALRVSVLETSTDSLLTNKTGPGSWRTVFESTPCRDLIQSQDGRSRHVTLGAGGRVAALSDRELILTVGEFSAEYTPGPEATPGAQDSYGKTIVIDLASGASRDFTRGHRNPQGLVVAPDGRVWETEHGARGGDELNLLIRGRDYGVPHVTYGTQYEMLTWPHSTTQARHEGYEKPIFAWVPSIATSQLIVATGKSFPWWSGDLLLSTLESRTLNRVRVEEGRVIFVEPILIGHRIRDLTESAEGSIVLKTDDDFLVYLDNLDTAPASSLDPVTRGGIVAGQCRSCHGLQADAPSGIGPNLWGVVGRRVASTPGYAYSDALRKVGGSWTTERLRAFVRDPGTFAPGSRMQIMTRYSDQQLDDLMAYLNTLR